MILAVGAVPKKLSYPHLDEIPVEVALDPEKLAQQPLDDATVAVFGSSHSSMIALPHLLRQPVEKVINFYRSPLKYAVYLDDWILFDDTGLKGRAAEWARENIDGVHPDRLETVLGLQPGIRREARRVRPRGLYRRLRAAKAARDTTVGPAGLQPAQRHYSRPACSGWASRFRSTQKTLTAYGQYRVGLKKFMDHLNAVLPLWLVYSTMSGSAQHQRRIAATPVHRTEPGIDTQPRRQ